VIRACWVFFKSWLSVQSGRFLKSVSKCLSIVGHELIRWHTMVLATGCDLVFQITRANVLHLACWLLRPKGSVHFMWIHPLNIFSELGKLLYPLDWSFVHKDRALHICGGALPMADRTFDLLLCRAFENIGVHSIPIYFLELGHANILLHLFVLVRVSYWRSILAESLSLIRYSTQITLFHQAISNLTRVIEIPLQVRRGCSIHKCRSSFWTTDVATCNVLIKNRNAFILICLVGLVVSCLL
jgi:hypothetical protein